MKYDDTSSSQKRERHEACDISPLFLKKKIDNELQILKSCKSKQGLLL